MIAISERFPGTQPGSLRALKDIVSGRHGLRTHVPVAASHPASCVECTVQCIHTYCEQPVPALRAAWSAQYSVYTHTGSSQFPPCELRGVHSTVYTHTLGAASQDSLPGAVRQLGSWAAVSQVHRISQIESLEALLCQQRGCVRRGGLRSQL
jgi:hypothetical protein